MYGAIIILGYKDSRFLRDPLLRRASFSVNIVSFYEQLRTRGEK